MIEFICPFCKEKSSDRKIMIRHIVFFHLTENEIGDLMRWIKSEVNGL